MVEPPKTLTLKLVRVCGPKLANFTGKVGEIEYKRERACKSAVYMTLVRGSYKQDVRYPADRTGERFKLTATPGIPGSPEIIFELCGTEIDKVVKAVRAAGSNTNAVVGAVAQLMQFIQAEVWII